MSALARVHFAANDRYGNFTGKAEAIQIDLPDDEEIEFYTDGMPVARFGRKVGRERHEFIRVGGRGGIRVRSFGWSNWVGNMAWDATSVRVEDAKTLIRWLLEHHATPEAYTCDGPVEAIIKEVRAQKKNAEAAHA